MKSFAEILFNDKYRSLFYRLSAALALAVLLVGLAVLILTALTITFSKNPGLKI